MPLLWVFVWLIWVGWFISYPFCFDSLTHFFGFTVIYSVCEYGWFNMVDFWWLGYNVLSLSWYRLLISCVLLLSTLCWFKHPILIKICLIDVCFLLVKCGTLPQYSWLWHVVLIGWSIPFWFELSHSTPDSELCLDWMFWCNIFFESNMLLMFWVSIYCALFCGIFCCIYRWLILLQRRRLLPRKVIKG